MNMTTEQTKIRLSTDDMADLRKLAEDCGINLTSLCALFVRSAKQAVKENGNRLHLPLKLQVIEEPQAKAKK
jgi:hypothetical protein